MYEIQSINQSKETRQKRATLLVTVRTATLLFLETPNNNIAIHEFEKSDARAEVHLSC